jgi:hypothetical protein
LATPQIVASDATDNEAPLTLSDTVLADIVAAADGHFGIEPAARASTTAVALAGPSEA